MQDELNPLMINVKIKSYHNFNLPKKDGCVCKEKVSIHILTSDTNLT